MILKDSQGKDRIKFSDIIRLNKEEPVFVKMKVRISTETMFLKRIWILKGLIWRI